jgi:hypothetical protein
MLPEPITPSAPALLTALHKRQPLAQTMPAWMMGYSTFSNFVTRLFSKFVNSKFQLVK